MGLLQIFRRQEPQASDDNEKNPGPGDDFWYEDTPGPGNHAGVVITPDIALKASAVYACVKILAETMASLPFRMHEERGALGRTPAPDHPLDEVIRFQPNAWQTATEFWEMMMLHAGLRGTAYAEIVPGARGAVDELRPLHTDRVVPEQLKNGTLRFRVTNPHDGNTRTLLQEEVFRFGGLSSDGIQGLRAVDIAAEAIGLGMAGDAYAARIFRNNLNIGGYLKHPKKLSPQSQRNLIHAFMMRLAGVNNSHRPIVLQEGMEFIQGSMVAKDAQLIEARKWQIGEIARFWRIPLHMLNIDDQTNRSTVETQGIEAVRYTFRPWAVRIEQAVRRDLIVAKSKYIAKFNLEGLLRGDSEARATYFGAALGSSGRAAWMTPNEVRAIEGMNPSDDPRANMLGGTLPTESKPSNQPTAITDQSPAAAASRLLKKEIAATRKSAQRFAGDRDGFEAWVRAFYGAHVSAVMSFLDIPKNAARVYCDYARDEILAADDLEALFDEWEETRAQEVADALQAKAGETA